MARIRFRSAQVFDTGGPGKGPRFEKDFVLDEQDVGSALGEKVTDDYARGFLERWVRRGVADYVDGRTPPDEPAHQPSGSPPEPAADDEQEHGKADDPGDGQDEVPDLSTLTRAQLEGIAEQRQIDVSGARNKAEIIAALTAGK